MINKLTTARVRRAHEKREKGKLSDGGNLYLQNGRYWRQNYTWMGKQQTYSHGVYPDVSLAQARKARGELKEMLSRGKSPKLLAAKSQTDFKFESIAREWWTTQFVDKVRADQELRRLEIHLFPMLGDSDIRTIEPADLIAALLRIESPDTIRRCRAHCARIFKYAIALGVCQYNPAREIDEALPKHRGKHYAHTTDRDELQFIVRSIYQVKGQIQYTTPLKLLPYFFVRPGMIRKAEWSEIKDNEWRIPRAKMKKDRDMIVPIARQPMALIEDLRLATGDGRYLFPNRDDSSKPMGDSTLRKKLRSCGISQEMITAHGFRHTASTMLHEAGYNTDYVEAQMAHKDGSVKGVYNAAEYSQQRRAMMQDWADIVEGLL